ncbi:MAG: MFS transporter [Chloroflexi bacterium]|nr:MFS transporter [Chloroflexota bacterium]
MNDQPRILTRDFILVCWATFAYSAAQSLVFIALPLFLRDLGSAAGFIGGFVSAVSACALIARLPSGAAVDRFGSRATGIVGAGFLGFSFVIYALILFAQMSWLLPLAGLVHGAGIGTYGTAANSFVAHIAPTARRGEAVGYYGILINVAQAFSASVSLFIVATWGMASLLIAGAGVAMIAALLSSVWSETPRTGSASFFQIESSAIVPSLANASITLAHGVSIAFLALLGLERGVQNPGIFFTANALTAIVARVFIGRIADKFGRLALIIPGMILVTIGFFLVAQITSPETLAFAGIIYGIGTASAIPALQTLIIDRAHPARRGAAMATYSASIDVGIIIGSFAAGLIAPRIGYGEVFFAASVAPIIGLGILLIYARALGIPAIAREWKI